MPPVCPETEAEQHRRAPSTSVTLLTRTCEPQGTRGSLKLLSTAFTLPREALAWGKSLWHSQGVLLVKGEGIPAILGFLEPPSPLLSSVAEQPEHSSRSLGLCQGISSSSRLTLAQSLWRRWESFPKCLPRSLSLLAARLSLARPRCEFSPLIPQRLERGEGRWSSAGEGGSKEENNNQKHGERDEMLQKSWPEGNKAAKNNPPKAAMGARGKLPILRNGVTLQLPPRCSC